MGVPQLWELTVALFWYWGLRKRFPVGTFSWKPLRFWLAPFCMYLLVAVIGGLLGEGDYTRVHVVLHVLNAILVGFSEEFLFRGVIQAGLTTTFSFQLRLGGIDLRVGTVLAALAFAIMHLFNVSTSGVGGTLLEMLFVFVFGLVVGHYYDKTGNIWGAIIVHGFNDSLNVLVPSVWT